MVTTISSCVPTLNYSDFTTSTQQQYKVLYMSLYNHDWSVNKQNINISLSSGFLDVLLLMSSYTSLRFSFLYLLCFSHLLSLTLLMDFISFSCNSLSLQQNFPLLVEKSDHLKLTRKASAPHEDHSLCIPSVPFSAYNFASEKISKLHVLNK